MAHPQILLRRQKGFTKHGADFGLSGSWNPSRAGDFSRVINQHINDESVVELAGTYRGDPVTHYFNPATGVNVMATPDGQFVSGWQLSSGQLENILRSGSLGGN
jgi:Colicin D